ncbi:MAG: hypothetical protein NVS9B3_11290 [Gemmatimonadaceae bacterium]
MSTRSHASAACPPEEPRPGVALPLVLVALVVIAALGAGVALAVTRELRAGRSLMGQTHAFALAEWGLAAPRRGGRTAAVAAMPLGGTLDTLYDLGTAVDSATVRVWTTRLSDGVFWIVSEARYSPSVRHPSSAMSVARTSRIMRLDPVALRARGAVTVLDSVVVSGRAIVDGRDAPPAGWVGCDGPSVDAAGIAAAPVSAVVVRAPGRVEGSPPVLRRPLTDDSLGYVRRGGSLWNALLAAAKTYTGGAVGPTLDAAGRCDVSNRGNWGEVDGSRPGAVTACRDYFPVVYSPADLTVGAGRGQGVLIVDGSLRIDGAFEWDGLIVVAHGLESGGGRLVVHGALMAQSALLSDATAGAGAGAGSLWHYSQCALARALTGAGRLVPVKERAWGELF